VIEQGSPAIEVAVVAEGCWRVCESARDENDPRRLVAFFEQDDGHIAVVWLRETSSPTRYASFGDALNAARAVLTGAEPSASRSSRPVPIPHRPPRTGPFPVV